MTDLADIPRHEKQRWPARALHWLLFTLTSLIFAAISWGVYIDDVQGLSVIVDFQGYRTVSNRGEFVYAQGVPVSYRITVKNRGNITLSGAQFQSSLHADGGACGGKSLGPDDLLPGASNSAIYTFTLSPGSEQYYEAEYIPPENCAISAHLKVRVQYVLNDRMQARTLTCPAHLKFD